MPKVTKPKKPLIDIKALEDARRLKEQIERESASLNAFASSGETDAKAEMAAADAIIKNQRATIEALEKQLAAKPAPAFTQDLPGGGRVIFMRAPETLTPEQIARALGGLEDTDPRWLAFNQLIDTALASAVLDASDQRITSGTYEGGRVAALLDLKTQLLGYRAT